MKVANLQIHKLNLHWWKLCDNTSNSNSHYLPVLATLGDVTQIGLFLFLVASPKVAKASTVMTVACCCHRQFRFANFANVNDRLVVCISSWTSFKLLKSSLDGISLLYFKWTVWSKNFVSDVQKCPTNESTLLEVFV